MKLLNNEEIQYISCNISNNLRVPVRVFFQDKKIFYYGFVLKDIDLFDRETLITNSPYHLSYIITQYFYYYAYLRYEEYTLVFGPFSQSDYDKNTLNTLALQLNLSKQKKQEFIEAMNTSVKKSLNNILNALLPINYLMNNERLSLSTLVADQNIINLLDKSIHTQNEDKKINTLDQYENNSLDIEEKILSMIESGDKELIDNWIKNIPQVKNGTLADNNLRQVKNNFIVTTTIVARRVIKVGVDSQEALHLSDLYISKVELLNTIEEVTSCQLSMIYDYTEMVRKIKNEHTNSTLIKELNRYVLSHLGDSVNVDVIAKALYVSRSKLFSHVKRETGMTVDEYILNLKISEAKRLLKYSSSSLMALSVYLGFSSQSHFNHAFKKFTGITPTEYKKSLN